MQLRLARLLSLTLGAFWLLACALKLAAGDLGSIAAWLEGALGIYMVAVVSRSAFLASLMLVLAFAGYQVWHSYHNPNLHSCGCLGNLEVSLRGHALLLGGLALLAWTGWRACTQSAPPQAVA